MHSIDALMTLEPDFIRLLNALPLRELQFNNRLRQKTRHIATLLAKAAQLLEKVKQEDKGISTNGEEVVIESK